MLTNLKTCIFISIVCLLPLQIHSMHTVARQIAHAGKLATQAPSSLAALKAFHSSASAHNTSKKSTWELLEHEKAIFKLNAEIFNLGTSDLKALIGGYTVGLSMACGAYLYPESLAVPVLFGCMAGKLAYKAIQDRRMVQKEIKEAELNILMGKDTQKSACAHCTKPPCEKAYDIAPSTYCQAAAS